MAVRLGPLGWAVAAQGGDAGRQAVAISKAAATRLTHRASLDDAAEAAAAEEMPPSQPPAIR